MNTITEIHPFVRDFKAARDILKERVERCQAEQAATIRRLHPGIKSAADKTRDARARLVDQIEANVHLFEKPRTQTIEGIKVGRAKGKGKTIVTDKALDLIKKHFPELVDQLINTKESVNKTALSSLSTADLKKIGVSIIATGDQTVITVPKDDLDKLVDAMLQDAEA